MNRRLLGLVLGALLVVVACVATKTAWAQAKPPQRALGFSNLVFRPAGGDRVGIADADFRVHILEESSTNRDDLYSANDTFKTFRNVGIGTTIVGGVLVGVGFALP